MSYSIKHSTKGYFQHPSHWIGDPETAHKWATWYKSMARAKQVAESLRSLDGAPLKLDIITINKPKTEFGFESYNVVDSI